MRVLVAIALLSVASALPTPDVPATFDFKSLFASKDAEASQDDSGIAINFADSDLNEEDGTAVHFVDLPMDEVDGLAINFVDSPVEDLADDGSLASLDDNVEAIAIDDNVVQLVDSPIDEEVQHDDGVAVNFVDSPVNEEQADHGIAVRFVDNVEAVAEDGADLPINEEAQQDDGIAVNFVDSPIHEIFDAGAADVIIIGNIFEPISASELDTINIVDLPEDFDNVGYPGKVYDNPLLR